MIGFLILSLVHMKKVVDGFPETELKDGADIIQVSSQKCDRGLCSTGQVRVNNVIQTKYNQ